MQTTTCACAVMAVMVAGCSRSPTGPSADGALQFLRGQTVSAADGRSTSSISVQINREHPVVSDANGNFDVAVDGTGSYSAVLSSGAVVERRTTVRASGPDRVRLSLIPASFDLAAFDEMFRTGESGLQRWTTTPRLVIVASVMNYSAAVSSEFPATAEQLTADEVAAMAAQLTEGLALLTGGTYTSFGSVDVERPVPGARVTTRRPDTIVVGRYNGVVTFAQTIGFGQWAAEDTGRVTAGAIYLDRDFDRSDPRRRLLRIHELGHALGYRHVTSRPSIMNPSIGPEPTEFDRMGATIAFDRPPGNRSPDTDPDAAPRPVFSVSNARWHTSHD
jgi:hypothetical protein